jgi:DNA-binding MarR family transcriptional regulator
VAKQHKQTSNQHPKNDSYANEAVIGTILRVGMKIQSEFGAALQKIGLSPANYEVLQTLSARPEGILSTELAGALHCTKANISQLVVRMEKNGLIQRTPSIEDKRSSLLQLTKLGRSQAEAADAACSAAEKRLLKDLGPADRKALLKVMAPLGREQ